MSCGKDAEKCTGTTGSHGAPEATATWAEGRDSAGHCDVCGGFLTRAGVCNNPHTMTMSLAGGNVLGLVDTDDFKGICPKCGSELSVGHSEEDWCIECEDYVTALTDELAGHIRALEDEDSGVRWDAADVLSDIGDATVIPALAKALSDDDLAVRQRVAEALGEIGDPSAIPALSKALGDDEDPDTRQRMAEALGNIGDASAVPALIKALGDEGSEACREAAEALGNIGDASAVPALIKALGDEGSEAHGEAVWALGVIGDASAVPALIKALTDDENSAVRESAADALNNLNN